MKNIQLSLSEEADAALNKLREIGGTDSEIISKAIILMQMQRIRLEAIGNIEDLIGQNNHELSGMAIMSNAEMWDYLK